MLPNCKEFVKTFYNNYYLSEWQLIYCQWIGLFLLVLCRNYFPLFANSTRLLVMFIIQILDCAKSLRSIRYKWTAENDVFFANQEPCRTAIKTDAVFARTDANCKRTAILVCPFPTCVVFPSVADGSGAPVHWGSHGMLLLYIDIRVMPHPSDSWVTWVSVKYLCLITGCCSCESSGSNIICNFHRTYVKPFVISALHDHWSHYFLNIRISPLITVEVLKV